MVFNPGFFNDGALAWLVNHEANIVIQVPSAVPFLGLSAIITHCNVDRGGMFWNNGSGCWVIMILVPEFWVGECLLDFVVTERWERPTAFNTTPLHSIGSGRGSIVLYNQASAFHWKLTEEKMADDAVSKYGGREKLAEAMASVAHDYLSR
jgi:hypothetical protein